MYTNIVQTCKWNAQTFAYCRRLWRPRHSLSKLAVQIINNKNTQTNCTGYGEDAIASYCLLCQLTYKFELTILSLHIPDEPKLLLSGKTNNVVQPAWYTASPFSKYCNKTLNNKTI